VAEFGLSPAEASVVSLIVAGRTGPEVADLLCLSPHTVHDHLKHAYAKLRVHNRAQLAAVIFNHPGKIP
jgi:DNA-binding CsgD family transcriptional regulator